MAKSKNKRTRTVSVRQDYRKGGKVKRAKKLVNIKDKTNIKPIKPIQRLVFRNIFLFTLRSSIKSIYSVSYKESVEKFFFSIETYYWKKPV